MQLKTAAMTDYEWEQLRQAREWLAETPAPSAQQALGKASAPAVSALQKTLPTAALKLALDAAHGAAVRLSDRRSVLKHAGLKELAELQSASLETCDGVADAVSRRAVALAGGTGAAFGIAGSFGLVADVPLLLIQALRIIHRVGLSYGEDCSATLERRLPVAVFALAAANTPQEKQAALQAIVQESLRHTAGWRQGMERAAQRELAKDAAVFSLNNLAKSLARHLGWRKAAGIVPVTGALIGGSVNAWYLYDVARCARRVFQMRWLQNKYGVLPADEGAAATEALAAPAQSST